MLDIEYTLLKSEIGKNTLKQSLFKFSKVDFVTSLICLKKYPKLINKTIGKTLLRENNKSCILILII